MPVTMNWDDPQQRVLVITFAEHWTWQEITPLRDALYQEMDQGEQTPVVVINDFSHQARFPIDILTHASQAVETQHPRVALYIVVGFNPMIVTFYQVFRRMIRAELGEMFVFAHSLKEARAIAAGWFASSGA